MPVSTENPNLHGVISTQFTNQLIPEIYGWMKLKI